MTIIKIKPLSVNKAWQGRRFKTKDYLNYEKELLLLLPKMKMPAGPYQIHLKFGFSNSLSDWDNPVKPAQDILSKKYGFNDKQIRRAVVDVEIVNKGSEYLAFNITTL